MKIFKLHDEAQVGIGTMIVFIATILVAAVAAAVLIDTSSNLQEKATATGNDATEEVGTSLKVTEIWGSRFADTTTLEQIDIWVKPAEGATSIDIAQLKVQFLDGTGLTTFSHGAAVDGSTFTATWIRDDDGSGTGAGNTVANVGDIVKITIGEADAAPAYDVDLAEREEVTVKLLPEVGSDVPVTVSAPNTFGDDLVVDLSNL